MAGTYIEHVPINRNNLTIANKSNLETVVDGNRSGVVFYLRNGNIGIGTASPRHQSRLSIDRGPGTFPIKIW